MRYCGIDPGLNITGYAVVQVRGDVVTVVEAGVLRPGSAREPLAERLARLAGSLAEVLVECRPGVVAVEEIYAHYKHPRTAIMMGHARGVILATAAQREIPVKDFSATQVKKSLTGNGRASKVQMQRAIMASLGLATLPEPADVADALAIALCAVQDAKLEGLS